MIEQSRGVQIQPNPIKTTKLIKKLKINQNLKSLDWIGSYFLETTWIRLDWILDLIFKTDPIQSKPTNII